MSSIAVEIQQKKYIYVLIFIFYVAIMLKKDLKQQGMMLLHKFTRFTKQQKSFVLYLLGLAFLLVFFPVINVSPNDIAADGYNVWLLSGHFFTTMVIIYSSVAILLGRNMSFRFKNIVINYFGFKEGDALINFAFIWIILTAFFSIGNTLSVVNDVTSTISITGIYKFTRIYLLAGLVLTLMSVIKGAKEHSGKTKIINVVDEDGLKEISNKKSLKGLFDHDGSDEE